MSTLQSTTSTPPAGLKLRENFNTGRVELRIGRKVVFTNGEYRTTAEYARDAYGLSDAQLMDLYHDYKKAYDRACG